MNTKTIASILISAALGLSFTWSTPAQAAAQSVSFTQSIKKCFDGTSGAALGVSYRYCIHTPASGPTNGDVAYLLHGRGLDENTWNDAAYYTGMIQQYWEKNRIVPPTVVTVSFGKIWLLTQKGKKPTSGLMDFFIAGVVPEVEAKTGAPKKQRILFGESMGGTNALAMGLKHGAFFHKVASNCPAVYNISPFAPAKEVQDLIDRTGADTKTIQGVIQLAQAFIADETEWKNFSPLHLVNALPPNAMPKFYLASGLYDIYGNFEGNELLANRAAARGYNIAWRPLYGGHCVVDVPSLAEFIAQ